MEEKIAEPINQELSQEKGAVENLDEGEEKLEKTEAHKKYDQMVRQSERIKEQGLGGIKIVDKASMVARKKNLEGNNLNLKNSFAVLDSLTLVNKFSKMGGNSDNINLEHFDLLKDLELARNDLKEKVESLNRGKEEVDKENLPLEELKFIEWTSDSSDPSDMEGFQMVSRRKKEKEKKKSPGRTTKTKGCSSQPADGSETLEGDIPSYSTRYNPKKGRTTNFRYSK